MSDRNDSPPPKRMKVEPPEIDKNDVNDDTRSDEEGSSVGTMVINPVSKFEQNNPEDSRPSTSGQTNEDQQNLREFQVLDEVNEDDSKDEDSDTSEKTDELPDEEIEKMLEENLPEGFKGAPKAKEKAYFTRQKVVLEEKGVNQFEVLPLDWVLIRHACGMPVYMHRNLRVCTLSKPYFLGNGNTRKHDIPISAIPCLAYRKALEEEKKQKEIDESIAEQIENTRAANQQADQAGEQADQSYQQTDQINQPINKLARKINLVIQHTIARSDREINKPDQEINKPDQEINKLDQEMIKPDQEINKPVQEINKPDQEINKPDQPITQSKQTNQPDQQIDSPEQSDEADQQEHVQVSDSDNIAAAEASILDCPEPQDTNSTADPDDEEQPQPSESGVTESGDQLSPSGCPFRSEAARKPVVLPGGKVMPPPRVETVSTSWKTQHLNPEQLNDYCKKLFKFKNVNILHFKRWADRRKYVKARKALQYPTLPEGTKLITIPANTGKGQENTRRGWKRDWVMNMNGCSYLSVFHEYVRRALHQQPVYEFKQLENAATPYQATVQIGGMQYGVGHGSSKRQAKSAAARASIHILIPEMKDELELHARPPPATDGQKTDEPDFSFFDYVGIEDPRVPEFCTATAEPSPHAILRTCLLRNFGAGDRHIRTEMKKLEYQKIELTMQVGKHSATVVCKNKKQAKQRASQAILQALHPHIRSWGSLLRLYGSRSVKSCKEKKLEEQQITLLQDKARQNQPNHAVLEKLRDEMRRLKERDEAVVPIGTLLVADDLPTHSGSMLNNVDL